MYLPPAFAETDPATLLAFMRAHAFATLVCTGRAGIDAVHVPLLVDGDGKGGLALHGHLARANPFGREGDGDVLAIFHGPHAYISPTWYDEDDVVPTWNYQVVHAHGRLRIIDDGAAVQELLDRLAESTEGAASVRWQTRLAADAAGAKRAAIVGFSIAVDRVIGKSKLSQNHAPERRRRVVAALRAQGGEQADAIAGAMERTLPIPGGGGP